MTDFFLILVLLLLTGAVIRIGNTEEGTGITQTALSAFAVAGVLFSRFVGWLA